LRLMPQAGTAAWRVLPEELDDGEPTTHTHYSYVWEQDSRLTRAMIKRDRLPEMHVWCADPARREIIDLSVRYQPESCRMRSGLQWLTPPPPDYLWTDEASMPAGFHYEPSESATQLAMQYITNVMNSLPPGAR